jgi:hypothetical protein
LLNNNSLDQFAGLEIWCRHQSSNHSLLLVGVIFGVFCGIPNARSPPPLKTFAWGSPDQKENSYTQPNLPLLTAQTSPLQEDTPKCFMVKTPPLL